MRRGVYPQSMYVGQFLASVMLSETAVHNAVGGYTAYRCLINAPVLYSVVISVSSLNEELSLIDLSG